MRRLIVAGLLLAAGCQTNPAEVTEESFIEWVSDTAVVLDADRWPETTPDDLEVLDDCVAGARVVMLGEADHYVEEKYDYRLIVIRYLVEHGFRWIGMEMGYSDGLRVDDYLETGDPARLAQVALYGYQGSARADRDDVPRAFASMTDVPFHSAFVAAETSFLSALREVSEAQDDRLRWFGFDIDPFPGGGYEDIEGLLEPHRSDPMIAEAAARLDRVPDETRIEEAERLEALERYLEAEGLELILGEESATEVHRLLRNLIESLRFRDLAYREPFGSHWMEGLQYREEAITDRIDHEWPPPDGARMILMGHNFHLSASGVDLRPGSVAEAGPTLGYPSFGSGVAKRMDTCIIWMLYDHGTSANALAPDPYFEVAGDPDRVERLLAGAGPVLVLDLADDGAAWLDRETNFISNGAYASGPLRRQTDVIFFVEEVHAVGARR
jgi:hypothetical protein